MANILEIKELDISNGPGCRVSIWFSGCHFHCVGCHNKHTWNFNQGETFEFSTMVKIMNAIEKDFIKDVSILGGEPLCEENYETCQFICSFLKTMYPDINIWLWTGYEKHEVEQMYIINKIDCVICGKYVQNKQIKHKYFGSSNQKVYEINSKILVLSEKYN